VHQRQDFDADRFAEFHWLVVEEAVTLDREPEARAVPVLFMNLNKDLGEIEPHKSRFPLAFEAALFFLLLAPKPNNRMRIVALDHPDLCPTDSRPEGRRQCAGGVTRGRVGRWSSCSMQWRARSTAASSARL
jgi:hypothetical protein